MNAWDSPEDSIDEAECDMDDVDADLDNPERATENSHFASAYTLRPNENYEANEYHYETDRLGRITHCEGSLRLEDGKRNPDQQSHAGGKDRLETDHGGHLIAYRFNGSEKIDNIVPMDSHLNQGEYKALENQWAKELQKNNTVDVEIRCIYGDDSARPSAFVVKYKVTDETGYTTYECRRLSNLPHTK